MTDASFSKFDGSVPATNAGPTPLLAAPDQNNQAQTNMMPARVSPRETLNFQLSVKGVNKLLEPAIPLLGLAVRIRNLQQFDDIEALHARLVNEVKGFQNEVEAQGYDAATVVAGRYALCAMIDESVLSQQWGAESLWPERPLLSIFHNETWGGEKFFSILDRVTSEGHRYVDLLEFLYFCLTLGFEGKYHVMHNGQTKLEQLIDETWIELEKHRAEQPQRLTRPADNIMEKGQHLRLRIPLWLIGLGFAVLIIMIHQVFDLNLNKQIDSIGDEIERVLGTPSTEGVN